MDQQEMETRIKNIDERTQRIEQILPTLATRDEIARLATKDELAKLPTRDELAKLATKDELAKLPTRDELTKLATKDELAKLATKDELREEGERTRRHFDVVAERLESHIELIAEGHKALGKRVDALGAELKSDIAAHDRRLTRLEASKRR